MARIPDVQAVDATPGSERFALRATRPIAPAEIARAVDSVVVARGVRGLLDRLGARFGLRRIPECPT